MKSLATYARFLERFTIFILIPLQIIGFIYQWFYGTITDYTAATGFMATLKHGTSPQIAISQLPFVAWLLSIIVDGISCVLLLLSTVYFIRILRAFQRGEIFTQYSLLLATKIGRYTFIWALYQFIKNTLLGLTATCCNPPGQHILLVQFTNSDIANIFIVGAFWVIISIIYEGVRLKQEHDLTV